VLRSDDSFPAFVAEAGPRLRATAFLLTGDPRQAAALTTLALAATSRRWRRLDPAAAVPAARAALVRAVLTSSPGEVAQRLGDDLADSDLAWSTLDRAPLSGAELSPADRAWLAELADLPLRARAALVLRLHEGLPEDDTARLLDTDRVTVAGLLDAALRQVGPLLDEPGPVADPVPEPLPDDAPVPADVDEDEDEDGDPYAIYRRPA
jgi:DNA-directed RNA polymerase specialized sigma24 family protein